MIVIAIRNPYIPADSKDPSMDQMKQKKLVCCFDFLLKMRGAIVLDF